VTLSFYLGIALAIVLFLSKAPTLEEQQELIGPLVADRWHQANLGTLVGSVLVMCSVVMGVRVAFAMPTDLRANWIFRVMPIRGGQENRAAVRRTLFALAVVPAWLASAAFLFWMWPWRQAAGHLAALGLTGIILAELCLQAFHKIPFTCSYLPGKTHFHIAAIIYVVLLVVMQRGAEFERQALLQDHSKLAAILIVLAVAAGLLRWRAAWLGPWLPESPEEELEFEDAPAPAVMVLGLNRDGTSPV